jgi:hypothetical protein
VNDLQGNCSQPFPQNWILDGPELLEKKQNQCLILLGETQNGARTNDYDLLMTSIRDNPSIGDPLWIDNVYFRSTSRRTRNSTLYVGGGLMMTNVTVQGSGYIFDCEARTGALDANDFSFHAEGESLPRATTWRSSGYQHRSDMQTRARDDTGRMLGIARQGKMLLSERHEFC